MRTSVHILVSVILAAALYPFYKWMVIFLVIGGVLIDVDHYLWYIYKYRKINLIECYKFYSKNMETNDFSNVMGIMIIFHTIEFLIVMIVLSFFSKIAFIFTIGLLSHYALDAIFLSVVTKKVIVDHSLIHWIYKNKIKKNIASFK